MRLKLYSQNLAGPLHSSLCLTPCHHRAATMALKSPDTASHSSLQSPSGAPLPLEGGSTVAGADHTEPRAAWSRARGREGDGLMTSRSLLSSPCLTLTFTFYSSIIAPIPAVKHSDPFIYIHILSLLSSSITFYPERQDTVPRAGQQDLIAWIKSDNSVLELMACGSKLFCLIYFGLSHILEPLMSLGKPREALGAWGLRLSRTHCVIGCPRAVF